MRLTLFTALKTYEFFLPAQVSGSYSFGDIDGDGEETVNVEAVDGQWILTSKDGTAFIQDNKLFNQLVLTVNEFYTIKTETEYLYLLTTPIEEEQNIYTYMENIDFIIGSVTQCNVYYQIPFYSGVIAATKIIDGQVHLAISSDVFIYIDGERVTEQEVIIKSGQTLNVMGLTILFLPNTLIINNPYKGVVINENSCRIQELIYMPEKYENIEVKDVDLYSKEEYFSKSPRIRRIIEEKTFKIDKPPAPPSKDEVPAILTAGPMLSMAAMSGMTFLNTVTQAVNGDKTFVESLPTLISAILMLSTSLLWPNLTKAFNKHLAREKRQETVELYQNYLMEKEQDIRKELVNQKNILEENFITPIDCLRIINTRKNNFWCKRVEQSDFLTARIGKGRIPLNAKIDWPEEGFVIEQDDLKKMAEAVIESTKYIEDSPQEYSFYENFLTAIMGVEKKCYGLLNNVLVQLMTFYCYDELKIIVFTSEENEKYWDYLKYSNYNFTNDKSVRFFATNVDDARELSSYLMQELSYKMQISEGGKKELKDQKPYYLVLCDNYKAYKKIDFFKTLMEVDANVGYSTIIIENKLDRLPSKCKNFINLNEGASGILKNSYEKAEITNFHDEIDYNINMMEIVKILSNIPIEIEQAGGSLPDSIEFLEMEKVGKVEKLNILNRWKTNDSTKSLKTEVGVDEEGNLMYLDLHEKFHGPHGLVAGTTGSGKSEFIITYILSLSMNYSPDDVAFILIDYKGGGLAFAFENKLTGVKLPHLAGTITNLDKSEMNRTLVSIDSEVKRRQAEFNKARDMLEESTIDIYKYQRFYHEGKIQEPIPHLFIISDEFAELKQQQPEFMENLISVARIGRSLGVHLILATQKPSGVVNDQIWTNTKFRVCLKVADAGDSNEMLKKPDAALLKQSGRFYLQVGMDEIYALGQSGWAGAKYFPSDKIMTKVNKSIDFIADNGQIVKTVEEGSNTAKVEAQGEQLAAVMKEIISVAEQVNKKAKKLWLDNIPPIILLDEVQQRYDITPTPYNVKAIIGEYDAPELQQQGIVTYSPIDNGNLLICGTDGAEREQVLNAIIYSICKNHSPEEVNFYTIDYGSESLRMFANVPHFGGMVFMGEMEGYNNLLKLLSTETLKRKKMFVDFGGDYKNYIKNSGEKLPIKIVILNNYDTMKENIPDIYDRAPELLRDSERYGIVYIVTANGQNSTGTRVNSNFKMFLGLKLKDVYDYYDLLGARAKQMPSENTGRGMINNGGAHEFQTAFIVEDVGDLSKRLIDFTKELKDLYQTRAQKIPIMPTHVRKEDVFEIETAQNVIPLGVERSSLDVLSVELNASVGKLISSNKITNTTNFVRSLIEVFKMKKVGTILLDGDGSLESEKNNVSNYFADNFDSVMGKVITYINTRIEKQVESPAVIIMYGLDKFIRKITDVAKFEEMFKKIENYEKVPIIVVEDASKIKNFNTDPWFENVFTGEGIWVGTGAGDQTVIKINGYNKDYSLEYPNDMGFYIIDGTVKIIKLLDFISPDGDE